jgi:hypothetical protein
LVLNLLVAFGETPEVFLLTPEEPRVFLCGEADFKDAEVLKAMLETPV